jgi:hypothetical protein
VTDVVEHTATLGIGPEQWSSLGVDASGEVYLVAYGGRIYRLEDPQAAPAPEPQPSATEGRHRPPGTPSKGTARPR